MKIVPDSEKCRFCLNKQGKQYKKCSCSPRLGLVCMRHAHDSAVDRGEHAWWVSLNHDIAFRAYRCATASLGPRPQPGTRPSKKK